MRAARTAAGMDENDVAREMATVDYRTVKKWEAGVDKTMQPSQRTVSRLELGEIGSAGGGKNPSLYVGPGVHLLYCYEQAVGMSEGSLTAGIYHGARTEEPLESRIMRDPSLTQPQKNVLLSTLASWRDPR